MYFTGDTFPLVLQTHSPSHFHRELDELEREDFTRLKMVKKKKEVQVKADAKEKLAREVLRVQTQLALNPNAVDADASEPATASTDSSSGSYVLKTENPRISTYTSTADRIGAVSPSKGAKSPMGGGGASARSPLTSTTTSARQRGMDDLQDDEDDVVFK